MRLVAGGYRSLSSVHSPVPPTPGDLLPGGRLGSLCLLPGQPFFVLSNILERHLENRLTKPLSQGKEQDHTGSRQDKPTNESAPSPRQMKQQSHGKQKKCAIHQDARDSQNQYNAG